MFDNLRRTRVQVDTDRLKNQAAEVGAVLSGASVRAGQTAEHLAHQAKDAAGQAKDWAAPRVERAWHEGRKAAAPKVEQAVEQVAEKALPLVDKTHDALVDDVLPKLVAAVNAAAAAAAVGADRARDVANVRLAELAHVPPPAKKHTGAKIFWSIAGLAIVGAVLAAVRGRRPTTDPWAEEPWEEAELEAEHTSVRDTIADAADAVGEAAGEAVAAARGTGEVLAEKARAATHRAEPVAPVGSEDVTAPLATPSDVVAAAEETKPAPKRATRKPATKATPPKTDTGTADA